MTPSHVSRYLFHDREILLKYTDGVMMPSAFSKFLAAHLPKPHDNAKAALDLGSGSGIQGIILAKLGWPEVFAVDIDKRCLAATEFNALLNQVSEYSVGAKQRVVAVHSDKFERIYGLKFDLIVSNPPTLPATGETPPFASGGPTGREFLDSMIEHSSDALNPGGRLIFVQSSLANIEQTRTLLRDKGFSVSISGRKRFPFRDFYMPHLFFYRRQAMLSRKAIYHENKDGMLYETLYIIDAQINVAH